MKLGFPYKEGDIVPIYKDWESQDEIIGTAKLVSFIRHGRSFILEDTYPEAEQIVYNYDEWRVELPRTSLEQQGGKKKLLNIRFIDTIGITNSADDEDYDSDVDSKLPKDNFLTFNDISCF